MRFTCRKAIALLVAVSSLLALLALIDSGAAAGQVSIPLTNYWQLLSDTRSTIQGLESGDPAAVRGRLDELAATWEAITSVELEGGTQLPVSHVYLAGQLRRNPPDLQALDDLLAGYQTLLEASAAASTGPQLSQSTLQSILSLPEYQWSGQNRSQSQWLQGLWDRLQAWLAKTNLPALGPYPAILAVVVLSLILVSVLAYFLLQLRTGLAGEARLEPAGSGMETALTARSARYQAQALSQGGDYRSAVRYLYLSSLLLLNERGLLRYDRHHTNHEVLQTLGAAPRLASQLEQIILVFDRVWYGYEPLDAQAYQEFSQQIDAIQESKPV